MCLSCLIPIPYPRIAIVLALDRYLLECKPIHRIWLVKFIDQTTIAKRIKSTAVPRVHNIMGSRNIIHGSPCRTFLLIQRAVLHLSVPVCCTDNMFADLTFFSPVYLLVLRHLCRILIHRRCHAGLRRFTLPNFIHTRHIKFIICLILQIRNCILTVFNPFNFRIFLRTGFPVIYIEIIRILHLLPRYVDCLIFSGRIHIIRSVRRFIYLRYHCNRTAVTALPRAVYRLHAHLVLIIVHEFCIAFFQC